MAGGGGDGRDGRADRLYISCRGSIHTRVTPVNSSDRTACRLGTGRRPALARVSAGGDPATAAPAAPARRGEGQWPPGAAPRQPIVEQIHRVAEALRCAWIAVGLEQELHAPSALAPIGWALARACPIDADRPTWHRGFVVGLAPGGSSVTGVTQVVWDGTPCDARHNVSCRICIQPHRAALCLWLFS